MKLDFRDRVDEAFEALVEHGWLCEVVDDADEHEPLFRICAETSCGVVVDVVVKTADPAGANIDEVEELVVWLRNQVRRIEAEMDALGCPNPKWLLR